jgi:K+-transporting ATPase KdpF subunit
MVLAGKNRTYERSHFHRRPRRVFRGGRALRPLVLKTLTIMETIIVGLIALALFAYLFIAMVYPEKF